MRGTAARSVQGPWFGRDELPVLVESGRLKVGEHVGGDVRGRKTPCISLSEC